ncbi:alpha/beta hydrolase [Sphingomonas koreensis]|nr:alpha/beta hydrolase [Sphingomonas koreensis]
MTNASVLASRMVRTNEPTGEILWHVEQRGSGPDIVLVPSGEGDCSSFEMVAQALVADYRVTTFDTPGFSRSITSGDVEISIPALAGQITRLIRALGIERATFYGCSSAGVAALELAADHAPLVHRAVVHEAALPEARGGPSTRIYSRSRAAARRRSPRTTSSGARAWSSFARSFRPPGQSGWSA